MKECWGCDSILPDNSTVEYCETCQKSLELIRYWRERGFKVSWIIPEQRARFNIS